jgi:hypothetical protein
MARSTLLPVVLLVVATAVGRADEDPLQRGLGPSPAQLVARVELERSLGGRVEVRWDGATGCPRSVRLGRPLVLQAAEPEAAAREAIEAVAELYGRVAHDQQPGRRDPRLRFVATRAQGALRHVRFEQAVGPAVLDGSTLVVTLAREGGRTVLQSLAGRVHRDAPPAFPEAGPAPAGARLVATPRGGAWQLAWETEEPDAAGEPWLVLRAVASGVEVGRSVAVAHGAARGTVYPLWRDLGEAVRPLRDLSVVTPHGLATTDDQGKFPGSTCSLPAGLTGPWERVLPRSGKAYPEGRDGALSLTFPAADERRTEVHIFHHLAEVRRFYQTIEGMPRTAWDRQVLVDASMDEFNAYASKRSRTVEGRRFDYVLRFGYQRGLDAATVAHERSHALLFGMDVVDFYGDTGALHEGYADYLAAVYTHTPTRHHKGGGALRDIDDDRIYPQHWDAGSAHASSVVFSGALWDARRAAGADGAKVDAAAMAVVPGTVAGGADVKAVAAAILDRADAAVKTALETELRRHGLLDDPRASAPVLEAPTNQTLVAGEVRPFVVEAYDEAEQKAGRDAAIDLFVDGPAYLVRLELQPAAGRTARATYELRPAAGDVGSALVTVTAVSRVTGKTAVRVVPVTVAAPGTPVNHYGATTDSALLEVQAGQVARRPLRELFRGLAGTTEPYTFSTSGTLSGGVALVGSELVAAPEAGEEGTHRFKVHAEPSRTARDVTRQLTCEVTLLVGGLTAEIVVSRPGVEVTTALPPGQPLIVEAGGSVWTDCVGEQTPAGRRTGQSLPADARVEAEGTLPDGVKLSIGGWRSTLQVEPPAGTGVVTWRVVLVLTSGAGASRVELARREVEIVVVPADAQRPTVITSGPVRPVVRPPVVQPPVVTTTTTTGTTPGPTPTIGFVGVLGGRQPDR